MGLYKEEKYPLYRGEGEGYSLCICWSETERLLRKNPTATSAFSSIGTLYSTEGVSIMVRNLMMMPDVEYLFLWANHPLSRSDIGKKGWENLKRLWAGKDDAKLHPEIESEAVKELVRKVQLIDVSNQEIYSLIKDINSGKYPLRRIKRNIRKFPESKAKTTDYFPSEGIGFNVRGKKVVNAWRRVITDIMRYGQVKKTEYGSEQKELKVFNWVIESEDPNDPYIPKITGSEIIGLDRDAFDNYSQYFLDPNKKEGVSYTYGERLRSSFDQIDAIIQKLNSSRITRRAVASTLIPNIDLGSGSPPCLNHIQFIADDKLDMFVVFRSQDIFKAGISNAFGLLHMLDYVSKKTGIPKGALSIVSNSAHIYEEDWSLALDIIKENEKNEENIELTFDPRGMVRIDVHDKIEFRLMTYDGKELVNLSAKTAREIISKITRDNLLSRNEHYCDISIELVKAEIAIKTGQNYVQDKTIMIKENISIS